MSDSNTEMVMYGFFSKKAAASGSHMYLTDKGEKVEVTTVTTDPEASDYNWPDKKCVGIVTKHLYAVPGLGSSRIKHYEYRKYGDKN